MKTCGCRKEETSLARPVHRGAEAVAWVMPTLTLVLAPKCPACLAAYIAMTTGIGISVSTAGVLRMTWAVLCVSALAILMTRSARRHFRKPPEQEEVDTYTAGHSSMQKGFAGAMDQLAE